MLGILKSNYKELKYIKTKLTRLKLNNQDLIKYYV